MKLDEKQVVRVAGFELNALNFARVLPQSLDGVRIDDPGTLIYDITGDALFRRVPLVRNRRTVGYADVAVLDVFAEPLLAVDLDTRWGEAGLLRSATAALRKRSREARFDETRFVAYSFPKLAVQFLLQGREVAMLELYSWVPVPPERPGDREADPNFKRWSVVKAFAEDDRHAEVARSFEERVAHWQKPEFERVDSSLVALGTLHVADIVVKLRETHELHYAPREADHAVCYELRGQQTPVWCVPASVEMILDFYRWRYDQPRIAEELDCGTCDAPSGLPYGDEIKVVNSLEKLSSNTLDANMYPNPTWAQHRDEISHDRPLISFIPGHSRTVAGFTESLIFLLGDLPYRGLLVYDPWPPTDCAHPENGGVITRWENFNTHTYRFAFTAQLQHL